MAEQYEIYIDELVVAENADDRMIRDAVQQALLQHHPALTGAGIDAARASTMMDRTAAQVTETTRAALRGHAVGNRNAQEVS